jgi:hypothetical protein
MQQELKATLTNVWRQAWDLGDVEALQSVVTPDYVRVSRASGQTSTLKQLQDEILAVRAGFPHLSTTIDAVVT